MPDRHPASRHRAGKSPSMKLNALTILAILSIPGTCSPLLAETPEKKIPNTINLRMGSGTLKFEHKKHIKSLDSVCSYCHLIEKGVIEGGLGKGAALVLCIPCHDHEPSVQTHCRDCHK